jgi:hypothetical protein
MLLLAMLRNRRATTADGADSSAPDVQFDLRSPRFGQRIGCTRFSRALSGRELAPLHKVAPVYDRIQRSSIKDNRWHSPAECRMRLRHRRIVLSVHGVDSDSQREDKKTLPSVSHNSESYM